MVWDRLVQHRKFHQNLRLGCPESLFCCPLVAVLHQSTLQHGLACRRWGSICSLQAGHRVALLTRSIGRFGLPARFSFLRGAWKDNAFLAQVSTQLSRTQA